MQKDRLVVLADSVDAVEWSISMPHLHFVIVKIINAVIFKVCCHSERCIGQYIYWKLKVGEIYPLGTGVPVIGCCNPN